jgi:hypothetical protein
MRRIVIHPAGSSATDKAALMVKFLWLGRRLLLMSALGCAVSVDSTTAPTSQPATSPATQAFQDANGSIRLDYPAQFTAKHDPDYVLSATAGDQTFTLDIPDLPPHIPNMIPLGLVVNGYKNGLKKSHPGVKIDEPRPPTVSQARGRELRSTWEQDHVPTVELALLLVHGDHVFIVRIVTPSDQLAAAQAVFDDVVGSLKFLN